MNNPPGTSKPALPRLVPYVAPWLASERDPGTVGAAIGLSVGGAVGGIIAWLGYPQLGGLIGAVLLMLLVRLLPHP